MTDLTEKAMLVTLAVRKWSAKKHDRGVSAEVASRHGTTADAGRYNKSLLAKGALEAIAAIESAARALHYKMTLPWGDDGARLLPSAQYFDYSAAMRKLRVQYEGERDKFIAAYPSLIDDARMRLNGLFDEADYPKPAEIGRKFGFDSKVVPLPATADFRVSLGSEEEARIRADYEKAFAEQTRAAMADVWSRLHDGVAHMAERLAAYQGAGAGRTGSFKDSLVENLRELAAILPGLNVTGDRSLADMHQRLVSCLTVHDAQALRDDGAVRAQVKRDADAILADMAGYTGDLAA